VQPVAAPAAISAPNPKTKHRGSAPKHALFFRKRTGSWLIWLVMQEERATRLRAYSRRIGVAEKRVLRRVREVSEVYTGRDRFSGPEAI
jgi:hypothetical protein